MDKVVMASEYCSILMFGYGKDCSHYQKRKIVCNKVAGDQKSCNPISVHT